MHLFLVAENKWLIIKEDGVVEEDKELREKRMEMDLDQS